MLGVFPKSVGEVPQELSSPSSSGKHCPQNGAEIMDSFVASRPQAMSIRFNNGAFLAYAAEKGNLLRPRSLASAEDIYCIFVGTLENLYELRRQYGLSKSTGEAMVVMEAYKTLRDRGPYPADQVVKDFRGHFAFLLFDSKCTTVFAAADPEGSVALFWGTAADGSLVFSDDKLLLRDGCGKSFAPFPAGCMYWSRGGLQSFEHPLHKMKAMPRVDSEGHVCGSTFKVDTYSKVQVIPRVGSSANWTTSSC